MVTQVVSDPLNFTLDWRQTLDAFLRILISFALALPIGWRGEGKGSSVGLRTFPVVAMASCGYALIVKDMGGASAESMARVVQGLVAGIGFIGGGTILKSGNDVRGLVTAASIWNTGAIGVAVALEREEIAIVLAVSNFLVLWLLTPLAERRRIHFGDIKPGE